MNRGSWSGLVAFGGTALLVLGMMLVIAGVMTSGLFLPGVVLIMAGSIALAASGVLHVLRTRRE